MATFKTKKKTETKPPPVEIPPIMTPPPVVNVQGDAATARAIETLVAKMDQKGNPNPVPWRFTVKRHTNGLIDYVDAIPLEDA